MAEVKAVEPVTAEAPKIEPVVATPEVTPAPATTEEPAKVEEAATKAEEETPKEEAKAEKPEPKEITQGVLSKSGRTLHFFKQKRFFYFQEEAIPEEKLKLYLFKPSSSKATAAHAIQTGKGLWFYSKDETHKDAVHGIIKLADVTEVTSAGSTKFSLKLASSELQFEAPAADRDNWVFSLNAKVEEAKANVESVTESEGYKATLEKLTHSATPAVAKATEEPAEEKKEGEETKAPVEAEAAATETPAAAPVAEESTANKSKRKSIALFSFTKKDAKKETPKEEAAAEEKTEEVKKDEAEIKPVEETPAPVAAEATETKTEEPTEAKKEDAPEVPRRTSIFGFLKKDKKEEPVAEAKKEETPAVEEPAKEVAAPEPVVAAPAEPVVAPVEAEKPAEKAAEKPAEGSKPTSPLAAFKQFLHRDRSPAPKDAPETETKAEPAPEPAADAPKIETPAEAPKEDAPAVTETPAVVTDAPKEATTEEAASPEGSAAASSPKEKRKSFFGMKRSESKDGSEKKEGFLDGLSRRVSGRGRSPAKEPKEVDTPAPVAEEEAKKDETVEAPKTETAEAPAAAVPEVAEEKPAQIGDVSAAAVTVGEKPVEKPVVTVV